LSNTEPGRTPSSSVPGRIRCHACSTASTLARGMAPSAGSVTRNRHPHRG
jgi:hypothetical protein